MVTLQEISLGLGLGGALAAPLGALIATRGRIKPVVIPPDKIGVRINFLTGKVEPLLSKEKETRNVISVKTVSRTGIMVDGENGQTSFFPLNEKSLKELGKDENLRNSLAERLNIPPEDFGSRLRTIRMSEVVIEKQQTPKPKQGLVGRIPIFESIALLPTSLWVINPSEAGVTVPTDINTPIEGRNVSNRIQTTPDFSISFRIMPSGAGEIIRRFGRGLNPRKFNRKEFDLEASIEKFKNAIESLGKSTAIAVTAGKDYDELIHDPVVVGQKAKVELARLLIERGLEKAVDLTDVVFSQMDLKDFAVQINQIAAERTRKKALGKDFLPLQIAETVAEGKAATVYVMGSGAIAERGSKIVRSIPSFIPLSPTSRGSS